MIGIAPGFSLPCEVFQSIVRSIGLLGQVSQVKGPDCDKHQFAVCDSLRAILALCPLAMESPGRSGASGDLPPYQFILEALAALEPEVRPMFSGFAVYVGEKIVLMLRDSPKQPKDNGVWLVFSETANLADPGIRQDFPSLRLIDLLHYARLLDMDLEQARLALDSHLLLMLKVARNAVQKVRPGGTLLFMGGTGGRRIGIGLGIVSTVTAALPALTASLSLELAPIRVNLIAAGFVDTPLSASLLGDELDNRRNQLRATLPIRRVVTPADVAALAVHIMSNTALTGATYDIDGGQQLVAG